MKKYFLAIIFLLFFSNFGFCETEQTDINLYVKEIETKIYNNRKPEYNMPLAPIQATLIIDEEGNLKSIYLKNSSGEKEADNKALKAITASFPV